MENNGFIGEEKVVAVLQGFETEKEESLKSTALATKQQASSIVITDDASYQVAANIGRDIKTRMAQVVEYFKPQKEAAHKTHQLICQREKEALAPYQDAEMLLKKAIGKYTQEQEAKRKAAEELARKAMEDAARQKLEEAAKLETAGKKEDAENIFVEAQVLDSASRHVIPTMFEAPKATGVSTTKDWKITKVDPDLVPTNINGMPIRPVDEAAVLKLIRISKGTIKIPGIAYEEDVRVAMRR